MHTLTGVLKQNYSNFEVIIVDDGSDHPVDSIIHPLTDDRRIRVYRTERSNANIARNYGIRECKGEYIAMLDADDYWMENHLHDCLALLQESGADGLYGSIFYSRSLLINIQNLPVAYARELKQGESMVDYLLTAGFGAQTSTLFTTADAMKDILWDPELIDHQDYDFVVRFHKKYKMAVKKEPTVVYYLSSGRAMHFETCIRFVENNMKDIHPAVYTRYNYGMYKRAGRKEETGKFVAYFRKEAVRYKECIPYQQYISVLNPNNRIREWIGKFKYLLYILQIQTKI
jgi:glycosyltransferase involved in cell wall biosynthesis